MATRLVGAKQFPRRAHQPTSSVRGWALRLGAVAVVSGFAACDGTSRLLGSSPPPTISYLRNSEPARDAVELLRSRMQSPARTSLVGASDVDRVEHEGNWLLPHYAATAPTRKADLLLPWRGERPFRLRDRSSGLYVEAKLVGGHLSRGEAADGFVYYSQAHLGRCDLIHRVTATGTDAYVVFARPTEYTDVSYDVLLDAKVAGLHVLDNRLEFLDLKGRPRLSVSAPHLIDAQRNRHAAQLTVEGCQHDTERAPTEGRRIVAPESRTCLVRITWTGDDIDYPAVLSMTWGIPDPQAQVDEPIDRAASAAPVHVDTQSRRSKSGARPRATR